MREGGGRGGRGMEREEGTGRERRFARKKLQERACAREKETEGERKGSERTHGRGYVTSGHGRVAVVIGRVVWGGE